MMAAAMYAATTISGMGAKPIVTTIMPNDTTFSITTKANVFAAMFLTSFIIFSLVGSLH